MVSAGAVGSSGDGLPASGQEMNGVGPISNDVDAGIGVDRDASALVGTADAALAAASAANTFMPLAPPPPPEPFQLEPARSRHIR